MADNQVKTGGRLVSLSIEQRLRTDPPLHRGPAAEMNSLRTVQFGDEYLPVLFDAATVERMQAGEEVLFRECEDGTFRADTISEPLARH